MNPEVHYESNKKYSKTRKGKKNNRLNSSRRRARGGLLKWQRSEFGRQYMKEQREKRKEKKHDIDDEEWGYCLEYFNNSCAYCEMTWEEHFVTYGQDLHKEHIIHDGRNDIKNCVPSCRVCNSEKKLESFNNWFNIENEKYKRIRYLRIYKWLRFDCIKFKKRKNIQ